MSLNNISLYKNKLTFVRFILTYFDPHCTTTTTIDMRISIMYTEICVRTTIIVIKIFTQFLPVYPLHKNRVVAASFSKSSQVLFFLCCTPVILFSLCIRPSIVVVYVYVPMGT